MKVHAASPNENSFGGSLRTEDDNAIASFSVQVHCKMADHEIAVMLASLRSFLTRAPLCDSTPPDRSVA